MSGPDEPPSARRVAAVAAALAIATIGMFWSALPSAFVSYDDPVYVTDNAHVRQGLTPGAMAWALTATTASNWHPVTWLSHMFDVQRAGLDARQHHLTSLLIHAANAALLLAALARLTGALWRSAIVAALFAFHPLHVESFAWVAERKDVLSTTFWILTLCAWPGYLRFRTPARLALVLVPFVLGLMSKPMLVTLPFTLLLLDVWPQGRLALPPGVRVRVAPLLLEKAPLFALAAGSCLATWIAQARGGALRTLQEVPVGERIANAVLSYGWYLGKTVWPSGLCVYYPQSHAGPLAPAVLGAALVLIVITVFVARQAVARPYLIVGWLWYLGTLVPVLGLVQVGSQAHADRYTYVPLVGIFVAATWGAADLVARAPRARVALAGAALAAIGALAVAARAQLTTWDGSEVLFRRALTVTSGNWLAHGALGVVCLNSGRIDEGIAHLTEAIRISPRYAEAWYNLGLGHERLGRHDDAISEFERALTFDPKMAKAHNNLAAELAGAGRADEALAHLRTALAIDPSDEKAWFNVGNILSNTGRADEAVERFREGLRAHPDSALIHNGLGVALARSGRMAEALAEFEAAVRLDSGFGEARANVERARASLASSSKP